MAIGSDVKDRITTWFIKNVLISKIEIIDQPGFVITRYTDSAGEVYLRELVLPEKLFIEIESAVVKEFGMQGRHALYSAGKKFGYRYGLISRLDRYDGSNEKQIKKSLYRTVRYLETVYAKRMSHDVNVKNRLFSMEMDGYIICSSNGVGLLVGDGALGGLLSYALNDGEIEGVQVKCQGRGDKKCSLICAPAPYLRSKGISFLSEKNLKNLELSDTYRPLNEIKRTTYATYSLKDLVDSGFFKYSGGVVQYDNERYFAIEASFLYLLESEIKKIKATDVVFKTAFNYGKRLASAHKREKQSYPKFVSEYLSALGFGDILVTKNNKRFTVDVFFYPWTEFVRDVDFPVFRGFLSGILSGFTAGTVILDNYKVSDSGGNFIVSFTGR